MHLFHEHTILITIQRSGIVPNRTVEGLTTSARSVPAKMLYGSPLLLSLCPALNSSLFILEEFKSYLECPLKYKFQLYRILKMQTLQALTLWLALYLGLLRLGFFPSFFPPSNLCKVVQSLDSIFLYSLLRSVILCLCKRKTVAATAPHGSFGSPI